MIRTTTLVSSVSARTKLLVDALSALIQSPAGRVIDIAIADYVHRLDSSEKQAVEELTNVAMSRLTKETLETVPGDPVATYEFSRLCFKRDVIEALAPNDSFRVITPSGVFQMTRNDFYRVFPNVTQSRSYLTDGIYHYPKLPSRAEQFRLGSE